MPVRILIVDDHEPVRRGIRSLLAQRPDWSVCGEAADGLEGVEMARRVRPDVILMDISMPRMDGVDATRVIRRELPDTKTIIVSQNDPSIVQRLAAEVEAHGWVAKTEISRVLISAIEKLTEPKAKDRLTDTSCIPMQGQFDDSYTTRVAQANLDCLAESGEMAALMRSIDWSKTPVGPVEKWPQSLKTALSILLTQKTAVFIFWGPEHVQFYNDAYRPILGTSKHPSAMGQRGADCWREIWDIIKPMLETVHRGESTAVTDGLLVIDRNGYLEEFYFNYTYSPIRDESGAVGGVFCVVYDTTLRVIGERRLRTLRELAGHGNQAHTAEEACRLAAETLAKNRHDLPFASLYLFDKEREKAYLAACSGVARGGQASPEEVFLTDETSPLAHAARNGGIQHIALAETGLTDLPGCPWPDPPEYAVVLPIVSPDKSTPDGFAFVGINPRKRLDTDYEGFLRLAFGHIGSTIAAARAFEEERRRSEALAELDRAKTAFFSNVSHEFRTPLSLMIAPLEDALAIRDGLAPEQRERLEVVHRNSLRLLKLVNTLLDFSRIEAGRAQARYEATDLASFTAELASVFRSAIERAGLKLIISCQQISEPGYVDREMWEKIVFNLISNAIKFTFKGEIEVSLRQIEESAELSVRDTGTGIPVNELPQVFERFHRIKGARGRTFEGSGIGLALVQELAKLHGGSVRAESEVDHGSTFTVTVPLGKHHLPADRIGGARTLVSTGLSGDAYVQEALRWLPETTPGRDEIQLAAQLSALELLSGPGDQPSRILLADDNADMRDYLERLLRDRYDVVAVADGEGALKVAREQPPDLILADVMMPRIDGFGLLQEIRRDAALKSTPVILLSARAGEEARIEGLEFGADDYLVKPFSARELLARVASHLTMARIRRDAAELERKLRAETEVQRARLHELFIQAPAAICVLSGPEHRFTFVNREYLNVTGRRLAEDLVSKTVREALPEIVDQGFPELLDGVYRSGVPYVGNEKKAVLNGADGPQERYFNFVYQPLRNAEGNVEGIFVHAVDVTSQVLARKEIERRERQFREMIDALPAAIYTTDAEGRITHFNPAAVKFSGRVPELGIDRWCVSSKLFHPDGAPLPHDECPMAIALKEGRVIEGAEAIAERRDGTRRWFTPYPTPLRDSRGNIVGGINMLVDITDRKNVEATLRESEERFRALVNASSYVVYRMSPDWTEMRQLDGRGFISDTGSPSKDWLQEYIHPEDQALVLQTIQKAVRTKSLFQLEHRVRRMDGTLGWTLSRAVPLLDSKGEIIEWFGAATDVTPRREAGENYRKLAETLDAEVRARTRELEARNAEVLSQSEQLRELSWQLLHTQDEERRHIARELHDSAGQILTVLGINLSMLVEGTKQKALEIAQDAVEAEKLVQQLTKDSRTTTYLLHPPMLDENGLPAALSWYIRGLTERSGLDIAFKISEHFGRLPRDMELVVFRLVQECLTNIHRHSGSKTAAIDVVRETDRILVEVRDHGRGMAPERLAEVQTKGSGVGIRGMRERLRQFHGEMIIDSTSAGTTVMVTIPMSGTAGPGQQRTSQTLGSAVETNT